MPVESKSKPGLFEKASAINRNIEISVAAVALFFGHLGIAALSAIGALIDHKVSLFFKKRRLRTTPGPQLSVT